MDNMDFRMLRNESGIRSIINYIPPLTQPQNYILVKITLMLAKLKVNGHPQDKEISQYLKIQH